MGEQVTKDQTRQKEKLNGLKKDLASVKKDADAAQGTILFLFVNIIFNRLMKVRLAEAQRKASKHNLSLSDESLQEYRKLYVLPNSHHLCFLNMSLCP